MYLWFNLYSLRKYYVSFYEKNSSSHILGMVLAISSYTKGLLHRLWNQYIRDRLSGRKAGKGCPHFLPGKLWVI